MVCTLHMTVVQIAEYTPRAQCSITKERKWNESYRMRDSANEEKTPKKKKKEKKVIREIFITAKHRTDINFQSFVSRTLSKC